MLIAIPYFGDLARFRPLLAGWFDAYDAAGMARERVILLTDLPEAKIDGEARAHRCGVASVNISGFVDVIRPRQPFDVKGALVCAFLLGYEYPVLVLDADACLARDPTDTLAPYRKRIMAMPGDAGAIVHDRRPRLDPPFEHIMKLCAGVMWFGAVPGRGRLVAAYRKAWTELQPILPWRPALPHLLEQYAWSLALRRQGGAILPATMNWSPRFLGPSEFAVVNHDYGLAKWSS